MKTINKTISKSFVFWVILIFNVNFLFTQSYLVHRYSESDGLSSANVYDIAQDSQGKIWLATRSGIVSYDGINWKKYSVADGLPVLSYFKISVDQNDRIWVLAVPIQEGIQLAYFDGSEWTSIPGPESFDFKQLQITSLALLDKQGDSVMPCIALGTSNRGIIIRDGGMWHNLTQQNGLTSDKVNGIVTLSNKFYIATDNGLTVISKDLKVNNQFNQRLGLGGEKIKGIAIQSKDKFFDTQLKDTRIWIYGDDWLGYFEEYGSLVVRYPLGLKLSGKEEYVNMLPDYRCGIYLGDRFILNYFNYIDNSWQSLDTLNGLVGGGSNSLFIDFEKNVWITCERGISKISSRRFANYQRIHGLLEDEVSALLEYEPGKFILGHNNGLTFFDGKNFLKVPFSRKNSPGPTVIRVLEMETDADKNIWFTASFAGLAKVNPNHPRHITWYNSQNGLPEQITSLWIDKTANKIWLGTDNGILLLTLPLKINRQGKVEFSKVAGLPICKPRRMYGDSGKLHYIASHINGLFVYHQVKKQWQNYRIPGNSNANAIYSIKKDNRGRLLIGTLGGLYILEDETLSRFEFNGFHIDRPVYFILEDQYHHLWFGTDNGVVRWDESSARTYSINEGLIGQETNRAAALIDKRRRIWIGTNLGLSIYDEKFDNKSYNRPPKIKLLYIEVSGKEIPLKENHPIQLSSGENTLAFHFQGISFIDETAIRFKNKLEGYEKRWSDEGYPYKQIVRYINLPPGGYRFHLKARNALGTWSKPVISPKITILKPFYSTWWFFIIIVLILGGGLYASFRYFSQKKYARLLEKQVEERTRELREAEQQYRSLFEESKDIVFISTIEGKLLDINPAGLELFGYKTKEDALGIDSVSEGYFNSEDRNLFKEEISKKGFVKDYEVIFKGKEGEPIITLITATVIRDKQGEIFGFRGIIRDITVQKKLEQQLIQAQKMEAIGTLAGGIAHDFNNILGAIIGYTELVLDDTIPGTLIHQNLENILNAAQRAAELVRQILAFSRQSGQQRQPVILGNIIQEALKLLRSSLPATIDIRESIQAETGTILGDPTQIHQIMMNLAANASHAMKETGGILEVSLQEVFLNPQDLPHTSSLKPGQYLKLMVSDTGHGIQQGILKRIFEPYFTTKKTGEGTGMGLAVIHGIVKRHGGEISVYSEPGKGSSFHILFPKIDIQGESKTVVQDQIPGGTESILLVDDEQALTETASHILRRLGYEVDGISDPIEALERFKEDPQRYQLVISDLTMPLMTGIQLAEKIKEINSKIPIIICSGFSSSLDRKQFKSKGISDFVMKPLIRSQLAQVVRRVLDNSN